MNNYKTTTCFARIVKALKRYNKLILQGGQGSGKTTSVMQIFLFLAIGKKTGLILSVIGDSLPNLKANPIRIFEALLKDWDLEGEFDVNKTDRTYTHKKTGNVVEFFSVDTESSRLGARRSHLYVSEADGIKYDTYLAVAGRSKVVIMDFNPKVEFWAHTELIGEPEYCHLISTFKDNEYLPKEEVDMLLWYKKKAYHNPDIESESELNAKDNIKSKYYLNKWRVFGCGMLGVAEGLVFTEYEDWTVIDELPAAAHYIGSGLDFGFSHVSALVKLYRYNDEIILDEGLFKAGLTATQLTSKILPEPLLLSSVIASDESRPEVIKELNAHGIPAIAAPKGAGSVDLGLDLMKSHKLRITARSENMLREFRGYAYATDKNGKSLGVPDKSKDLDNSIDAARYAFRYFLSLSSSVGYKLKICA